MEVILFKNNVMMKKGDQAYIREVIEEMIEERLGLYLELQEFTDNDEYEIYLHTDCYDYLSSDDIEHLEAMKITDDPGLATEGIKRFLNIDFELVNSQIA